MNIIKLTLVFFMFLTTNVTQASETMSDDVKKSRCQIREVAYGENEASETLTYYDGRQITRLIAVTDRQYSDDRQYITLFFADGSMQTRRNMDIIYDQATSEIDPIVINENQLPASRRCCIIS